MIGVKVSKIASWEELTSPRSTATPITTTTATTTTITTITITLTTLTATATNSVKSQIIRTMANTGASRMSRVTSQTV